jgi:hypothetical protein
MMAVPPTATVGASTVSAPLSNSKTGPYKILGIVLVVDEIGHGARMAVRYPCSGTAAAAHTTTNNDDLFYTLSHRQMAKLFRPKPALCNQPMTLSVGGTVFCCCAALIDTDDGVESAPDNSDDRQQQQQQQSSGQQQQQQLSLFSVVVALASCSSTLSVCGWTNDNNEASASFRSIRRVHVSLARLCRVLEREERRCAYVSAQAKLFQKIRHDVHKQRVAAASSSTKGGASSPVATNIKSTTAVATQRQRLGASFSNNMTIIKADDSDRRPLTRSIHQQTNATSSSSEELQDEQEEQEILEVILASSSSNNKNTIPQTATSDETTTSNALPEAPTPHCDLPPVPSQLPAITTAVHQGNLARELVAVYHALARNDHELPPSPSDLLTGLGGIVYINRHVAVAIEALTDNTTSNENNETTTVKKDNDLQLLARPYHTLLFPQASPSQLLESLTASGAAAPRRLQQFLCVMNPQHSLQDIAANASLSLQTATEIATYLARQGACVSSPVVSRTSRLGCQSLQRAHDNALAFAQLFGPRANVMALVSFLCQHETLGQAMTALTTEEDAMWLRERLQVPLFRNTSTTLESPTLLNNKVVDGVAYAEMNPAALAENEELRRVEALEELLYNMAVWLCARNVLSHSLEFLVLVDHKQTTTTADVSRRRNSSASDKGEKKADGCTSDESIFNELIEAGCLEGTVALKTCGWKLGMDYQKLRSFALRHERIRIVTRVAVEGDEW